MVLVLTGFEVKTPFCCPALLWCRKGDGVGGVSFVMKEELCEKMVEVRKVSEIVTAVVLVFKRMRCG